MVTKRGYVSRLGSVGLMGFLLIAVSCERDSDRERLAARVKATFGLTSPVTIRCSIPMDGPTRGLFIGARGESLTWTWDPIEGRGAGPPDFKRLWASGMDRARLNDRVDSFLAYPPHLVHLGSNSQPLAFRSPAESLFIQILWSSAGADTILVPPHHMPGDATMVAMMLKRQQRGLPAMTFGGRDPEWPLKH
jgi:hypothetical protein